MLESRLRARHDVSYDDSYTRWACLRFDKSASAKIRRDLDMARGSDVLYRYQRACQCTVSVSSIDGLDTVVVWKSDKEKDEESI